MNWRGLLSGLWLTGLACAGARAADNQFFDQSLDTLDELRRIASLIQRQPAVDIGLDEAGKIKRYQNIGRCGIREVMSYPMPLTGDPLSRELKYNSWDFSGVVSVELRDGAPAGAVATGDDNAAFVIAVRGNLATLVNFKSQSIPVDSVFFKNPTVDTNKNLSQFDFTDTGRQRALDDKAAIERLARKCI
jgi:hypothetical protein